jgi:hypothetical protein
MKPLYFSRNETMALSGVLLLLASFVLFFWLVYTGAIHPVPSMYHEPTPVVTTAGCYGPAGPYIVTCEAGQTCECPAP